MVCRRVKELAGRRFGWLATAPAAYPYLVVGLGVLTAVIGGMYASRLTIDSDFTALIPQEYESVKALNRLKAAVGGESEASIAKLDPIYPRVSACSEESPTGL